MDAKKTARIGTLRNAVTEQVVDGVDVDVFLSEIDDPANWEGGADGAQE